MKLLIFVIICLMGIFILSVLASNFEGKAKEVAETGAENISLGMILVLSIPPISFFIGLIALIIKSTNSTSEGGL